MNPNQQSEFRFDSKMIAKRTGKIIKDKQKTSFDNYYDLQSAEFNPQTIELMRNFNRNSTNILGHIVDQDQSFHDDKILRNNIWKLFEKFNNNKQQLEDPKQSIFACLNKSLSSNYLQVQHIPQIQDAPQVIPEHQKFEKQEKKKGKNLLKLASHRWSQKKKIDEDYQKSVPSSFTVQKLVAKNESTNSRYPIRLRLKPLHFWQGERAIYQNDKCVGILRKKQKQ